MQPNRSAIADHIMFLFGDPGDYKDGLIEIAYTPHDSGAVNKAEFFSLDQIEKAIDFAVTTNSRPGVNVYIGAALRSPDTPPFGRSSADDFYAAPAIWCDLDDPGAATSAKTKYAALPPSLIVVTGRHPDMRAQAWWKLMFHETNAAEHNQNLAHICAALGGDRAVVDPARVMRLGGTIAWPKKDGRIPELTEVKRPDNPTVMVMSERFKGFFPNVSMSAAGQGSVPATPDGKPRSLITHRLKYPELLERTRTPGHWHANMRDAVASMVSSKWTDEQIRLACAPYCNAGASDPDLTRLITTARTRWAAPDPSTNQIRLDTGEIKPLTLLYADDITPVTETSDFVENTLRDNEFSVIYGESNCGKTFFMLDLAMHVALGRPWRGRQVDQGGVIYAALEGGHGTKNRIVAFKQHHEITDTIPLAIIPSNINFLDAEGDIMSLIAAIEDAKQRIGNVRLIVIDTLARAISGGDENSSMDMGQLIINADLLRARTSAHISFIHHSGKDAAKGARGHSSLRAAVDTEIEISRPDPGSPSLVKIVKQREMEMTEDMAFSLKAITLGVNQRRKDVTSCAVIPADVTPRKAEKTLTAIERFVLDALVDCLLSNGVTRSVHKDMPQVQCVTYFELYKSLESRGFKELINKEGDIDAKTIKASTNAARIGLKNKGKINFDSRFLWLAS